MSQYHATVQWQRAAQEAFVDNRYHRAHRWRFDGGAEIAASSSPQVVPLPYSDAGAVDPEEAFVASLSSCHLLWFLSIAAAAGHVVEHYEDEAVGTMARNAQGQLAMTEVVLRPRVAFAAGRAPTPQQHAQLHHRAHAECFIASSVKTEVRCEPELV
jgi:organic hydroperoxide reductase OsmC/OhrA